MGFINRLLLAALILIAVFIIVSLINSIDSQEERITVKIKPANKVYLCFEYPMAGATFSSCYLNEYNKLRIWSIENDLVYRNVVPTPEK